MEKILFINPPQKRVSNYTSKEELEWIPLGLCYLSAVAEKEGFDSKVIDLARDSFDEVKKTIEKEKPSIIGISCWTDIRMNSFEVAKLAKKIDPGIKILMGGSHATFFPEHLFKLSPVDLVILGEGEETLKEVLRSFKNKKSLSKIKGIVFRSNNKLINTGERPLIKNLDSLLFPSYNGLDLKRYKGDDRMSRSKYIINGVMISSRGCPFDCIFCSTCLYWKRMWRARSSKNVVDEMEHIHKMYGINNIRFWDDHFALDKQRAIEICKEIIKRGLNKKISWSTSSRVDCINEEVIKWMKKAGCNKLIFGVESGSPTILKNINKGFTVDDIKKAFDLCHKYKIFTNASIMIGNPGENDKTIDETISLLNEIKPDNPIEGGSILIVFPKTKIYEDMKAAGKINDNYWLKDSTAPFYSLEHTWEEMLMLDSRLVFGLMPKTQKIKFLYSKSINLFFKNPRLLFKLFFRYIFKRLKFN